jgi:glycosyltransferase involved in cell wall biosynthesis
VERALETLLRSYPEATLVAPGFALTPGCEPRFQERLKGLRHATNGDGPAWRGELQIIGRNGRRRHFYGPKYARHVARQPLGPARTVLSMGGAMWSLAAAAPPGSGHCAWVGGPPRALYGHSWAYLREYPRGMRPVLRASLPALRAHHRRLLRRPARMVTNSRYSAEGLAAISGRDVGVVYPPVRTDYFTAANRERGHFVTVARLRHNKRVDLLIDAFRELDHELVIAGEGPLLEPLRASAPSNVRFVGHLEDADLRELYRTSIGMVSASVEEFGICLVEALATGTPVVAPRRGGSGEIVDRDCGVLLDDLSPAGIASGVRAVAAGSFAPEACRRRAERFSEQRFVADINRLLEGDP